MPIHDQRHIIEKQIVELTTNNQEVAKNLQNLTSTLIRQKILPEIEKICNKYSDQNTILRFEQLELDIGTLTVSGFETEFFESSVKKFAEKLDDIVSALLHQESDDLRNKTRIKLPPDKNPEGRLIQKPQEQLEILQYFLETGQIPWYQQYSNDFSVSKLFHQLVHDSPQALYTLVKNTIDNKNILKRFIYQFDDEIKLLTFNAICQKSDNIISDRIIQAILDSWKHDRHMHFSKNKYKFLVWYSIYNELVIRKNSSKYFVINLIFLFLKEIIRTTSSVEDVLIFLALIRKEFNSAYIRIKSVVIQNLVSVSDTFIFYIIHKLSEEQDIEKNLRTHNQLTGINGQKIRFYNHFKKQINEQIILEIKKLIENSGFASLEKIKAEILTKGRLQTEDLFTNSDIPEQTLQKKPENDTGLEKIREAEDTSKEKHENDTEKISIQDTEEKKTTRSSRSHTDNVERKKITNNSTENTESEKNVVSAENTNITKSADNKGNIESRKNAFGIEHKIVNDENFTDQEVKHFNRSKPIHSAPERYPFGKVETIEQIYIQNAGLALVWPYLPALFKEQKLLTEKQQFKNFESQILAVCATHYLVYGNYENVEEYALSFNKLLCGFNIDTPIPVLDKIPEFIRITCDEMLTEAVQNWTALKNSTINGLRTTFLQREGRLSKAANGWKLYIERLPFDVLMERLPWSIAVAVLPWNTKMIYVEW